LCLESLERPIASKGNITPLAVAEKAFKGEEEDVKENAGRLQCISNVQSLPMNARN